MTTSSGTAISAPTKPHSHDQKATAMKIATALISSRRPTTSGVTIWPSMTLHRMTKAGASIA